MEMLRVNETDLAGLGRRIDEVGMSPFAADVATLAEVAACYGVAPGASAALVDPTSPDVVRERAFAVTSMAVLRAARDAAWDDGDARLQVVAGPRTPAVPSAEPVPA